jgi:hypothetical protein
VFARVTSQKLGARFVDAMVVIQKKRTAPDTHVFHFTLPDLHYYHPDIYHLHKWSHRFIHPFPLQ